MSVLRRVAPFALSVGASAFLGSCTTAADTDGDGFTDDEGDCAPDDPGIYPGAPEVNTDQIDANCDGSTTDTDDVGDDDTSGDDDDDPGILDSTEMVTGDWSCKGVFVGNLVSGAVGTLTGRVDDFEDDVPVPGAHVQVWVANDPENGADTAIEALTGDDGTFTLVDEIESCTPYAIRVWTEFDPPETYQTYQVNFITSGAGPWTETFNSVAYSTYNLLPLTVGVEPEPGRGIAAGSLYDCAEEKIANAEVSVGTVDPATGLVTEATGYAMRYFRDESPNGDQMWVSEDGLFGGMNVPPGSDWSILVWGIPQAESHCELTTGGDVIRPASNPAMCLLATQSLFVIQDSVNIANVRLQQWPLECLEAPIDGR